MNGKWRILVILIFVAFAMKSITPPKEQLGLGKDLAGGTTITYRIDSDDDGNPPTQAMLDQIISVIRQRIDPKGIFDIGIVPQGTSQIEISMPLPTEDVRAMRRDLDDAIQAIRRASVSEGDIDSVLQLPAAERSTRIESLSKGVAERIGLFEAAGAAFDNKIALRQSYDGLYADREADLKIQAAAVVAAQEGFTAARQALIDAGIDAMQLDALLTITDEARRDKEMQNIVFDHPELAAQVADCIDDNESLKQAETVRDEARPKWDEQITPAEIAATDAEIAYGEARSNALRTSLDSDDVRNALDQSTDTRNTRDPRTNELITELSPRERALTRLKDTYPLFADLIDVADTKHAAYKEVASGYDDPKDLIALLKGAGVLTFRIGAKPTDSLPISALRDELAEGGPNNIQSSTQARWFKLDKLEQWYKDQFDLQRLQANPETFFAGRGLVAGEFDGEIYLLLWTTSDRSLDEKTAGWELTRAGMTQDQAGRPAVSFQLNPAGASAFRKLTSNNKQKPLAIVLDDRVYSAPNINAAIGASGVIEGEFTTAEIRYLLRVLNAGTLQAKLKGPVAQSTIGPSLGADNLRRGLRAGIVALIVVGIFMLCYYFLSGVVANIALVCNALFILGIMANIEAAFTMPGIAGIVLTFGMAVDSNVLIYERIREELETGADLKTAIRLGFEKVTSTIVDANVTNLIVCFVLGFTATAEVKGFAITLGIGIISTLFCALFVTRAIFDTYESMTHANSLPMLPSVLPALNKILHPKIHWVKHRIMFWGLSCVAVLICFGITANYWNEMLDTVFKGGTSVTITFHDLQDGSRNMVPRAEVEAKIEQWARDNESTLTESEYNALSNVQVLNRSVDEVEGADFRGNEFVIKSTLEETKRIEEVIQSVFPNELNTKSAIYFDGYEIENTVPLDLVLPILEKELGRNINEASGQDVRRYVGGVAIKAIGLRPASTIEEIQSRIERLQTSEEFKRYANRDVEVFGLTSTGESDDEGETLWSDVAVVINSPNISIFDDRGTWDVEVAAKEWTIVRRALTEPPSLDQVTQIGAEVAAQFRAKAIVAITLSLLGILAYIWFRFGSLRYSFAAIVALVHDVAITLGLLALTHAVYDNVLGQTLRIEPFKIDLGVIAALLTIIGYSLNDTIVILDRIRENRGKLAVTSEDVVNKSINQTFSRTILTSGTTLLAVGIMYWFGGTGIRPFTFAMLCGVMVGTYSSIAVAAPMVFSKAKSASTNAS